jgi:hypothetical protein
LKRRRVGILKTRGREEMVRKVWIKKANIFDKNVKRHLGNVKVLLLGPGYPEDQLKIRTDVEKKLEKDGCDIYIMETMKPISSFNIDEKFRDILDKINPDLILCIFTEKGVPHGVIFEVGFICAHYDSIEDALERLRFCIHEKSEKIEDIPSYLHFLMSRTRYYEFYDEGRGPTLYHRITQFIQDEVVRQFCPTDLPQTKSG